VRWSILLLGLVFAEPLVADALIDEDCLAIENAFAEADFDALLALEPGSSRWQAHRDFRLAAGYIALDRNADAVMPLKRGLSVVAAGLAADEEDVEQLLTGVMLDGQFLLVNRWRFLHNGLRGLRRLDRAAALQPDNVRLALIQGTAKIVLPGVLGGNAREAADIFSAAADDVQRCAGGEWGQIDVMTWLGRTWTELGEPEKANRAFAAASARDSGNYWLRRELEGSGYRFEQGR
jgi:hypothetical protein